MTAKQTTSTNRTPQTAPTQDDIERANRILAEGEGERPTVQELADWTNSSECPPEAVSAACDRLSTLLVVDVWPPLQINGHIIESDRLQISILRLWHAYTSAVDAGAQVRWPLYPLVNAWQRRPRLVEPNRRLTNRVIPGRLAMADGPHNPRMLFSPAAHASYGPDGQQLVLPGFTKPESPSPALPLALYDLGAGPAVSPGKSAPLALRIFVESVLSVPMQDRERGQPVAMSVSLREFLSWLYPARTPSPAEYWPRLMAAIDALESRDARIPLYDPITKRSELRRIVSVSGIPRGPGALDDSVRILVDLPPQYGNGPQVSDHLRYWGVTSAPAYRLLINIAYQWHNPGVTTIPIGKGKGRHWVQVNDAKRYKKISDDDLISLTFPSSTHANRRLLLLRAKKVVETLASANEIRIEDGKIMPPTVVN